MEEVEIDEKAKSLRQAQTDNTECHPKPEELHPQLDWGSHDVEGNDEIATSPTCLEWSRKPPRNDSSKCHPEPKERHSAPDAESHDIEKNEKSLRQAQTDNTQRHPEPVEGSQPTNLKLIYVGGLTPGKQPLLSVQVVHKLKKKGYAVQLDMYGDGIERTKIADYILDNALEDVVVLHGNTSKEIVKEAYQKAHFLVFVSKSEGWPKVVAEAMFWACVPITSSVSCIPSMLDFGKRGSIVNADANEIISAIETYLQNPSIYKEQAQKAMDWSRQYTLEKFEEEIGKLL
nr:glycosyltransferase [Lutibacter sp. HS1-25]